jgi:hypothetical protein
MLLNITRDPFVYEFPLWLQQNLLDRAGERPFFNGTVSGQAYRIVIAPVAAELYLCLTLLVLTWCLYRIGMSGFVCLADSSPFLEFDLIRKVVGPDNIDGNIDLRRLLEVSSRLVDKKTWDTVEVLSTATISATSGMVRGKSRQQAGEERREESPIELDVVTNSRLSSGSSQPRTTL